jgi:hypothetical protein
MENKTANETESGNGEQEILHDSKSSTVLEAL